MNGYVEGGYVVSLSVLALYASSLLVRMRRLREASAEKTGDTVIAEERTQS